MFVFRTPSDMYAWSKEQHLSGKQIGFVPTMGALHHGHATLLEQSKSECDATVLSIFVNPTQFNVESDFEKYPRTFESDLSLAEQLGVSAIYAPDQETMYPQGFNSYVEPGHAADPLEGVGRPGHFRGVTTVVLKLFHAVSPDVAYFGKKDFQQLAVIKQMVQQLDMPLLIQGVETVRDTDGLALSSRNVRLTNEQRSLAPIIYQALQSVRELHHQGESKAQELEEHFTKILATVPDARLEYTQVVDATTLEHREQVTSNSVMCVAVWFGDVRLIDNIEIN